MATASRTDLRPTLSNPIVSSKNYCNEKSCACVCLVAGALFLILAALCVISCKSDISSLPSFFKDLKERLALFASRTDTTPFTISLFLMVAGGVGTVGCIIWRAKLCCEDAHKAKYISDPIDGEDGDGGEPGRVDSKTGDLRIDEDEGQPPGAVRIKTSNLRIDT